MEQIVEVVRDPTGQYAYALQLLYVIGVGLARLGLATGRFLAGPELLGELVVGGDITHQPAETERLVPRPAPGHGQGEGPVEGLATTRLQPEVDALGGRLGLPAADFSPQPGTILRGHERNQRLAHQEPRLH